jgi:hypothetical protein
MVCAHGLSWQIVPEDMDEMMSQGRPEQIARVTQAFLEDEEVRYRETEGGFCGVSGEARLAGRSRLRG